MNNPFHPYPMPKLTIELVPAGQWGDNLRSHFTKDQWDATRKACYINANNRCECCGGVGPKHPVECHEIWDYNDQTRVQALKGLIALCPACHEVKHVGLASVRGRLHIAINHLANVNEWPLELAEQYVIRQFEIHQIRSQFQWTLNLDWLKTHALYVLDSVKKSRERHSERIQTMVESMTRKR